MMENKEYIVIFVINYVVCEQFYKNHLKSGIHITDIRKREQLNK